MAAHCKPIVAEYTVVRPDQSKDRLIYQVKRPCDNPNQGRRTVHWDQSAQGQIIYYDEDGRPSDVGYQMSLMSKQNLVARRKTPRTGDVVED